MEKKQYTFSATAPSDDKSFEFFLDLAVVAICTVDMKFGMALLGLSELYEKKIMKEAVNE